MARLTHKQLLLLKVVADGSGNLSDWWLDIDQVLSNLAFTGWTPTKQSLQFSIRSLLKKRLVERRSFRKRKSYNRRVLATTNAGRAALNESIAQGRVLEALRAMRLPVS